MNNKLPNRMLVTVQVYILRNIDWLKYEPLTDMLVIQYNSFIVVKGLFPSTPQKKIYQGSN